MYEYLETFTAPNMRLTDRKVYAFASIYDTGSFSEVVGPESIISMQIEDSIVSGDDFEIGTVIAQRMVIQLKTDLVIPVNAAFEPWYQTQLAPNPTDYIALGLFYVDSRTQRNGIWTFTCFSQLIQTRKPIVSTIVTYPADMLDVLLESCTTLNIDVDTVAISAILNQGFEIPVRPDATTMTHRDIWKAIGTAYGVSFRLDGNYNLNLVQFDSSHRTVQEAVASNLVYKVTELNVEKHITRLVITSELALVPIERGTGDEYHTLYVESRYATEAIADYMYTQLNGYTYTPVEVSWAGNGYMEAGDFISFTSRGETYTTVILRNLMKFSGGLNERVYAPAYSAQQSEFDVQQIPVTLPDNVMLTDEDYFGVVVTKTDGITVTRSDAVSKMTLNSDEMKWEVDEGAGYASVLYLDAINKKIVFNGVLGADVLVANTTIIQNLSAETGNIAELTVDRLETSTKVQNYLVSNTDDVNYIRIEGQKIEYVTATISTGDVQLEDRYGNLLYWLDDTNVGTTINTTAYPVMIYNYTELTKMTMEFVLDGTVYVPVITLGAGNGVGNEEKARIYKDADGLSIEYEDTDNNIGSIHVGKYVDATHRRIASCDIDTGSSTITILGEGQTTGDETVITYVEATDSITYTWEDSFTTTISIHT